MRKLVSKLLGNAGVRNLIYFLFQRVFALVYMTQFATRITTSYCGIKRHSWIAKKQSYLLKPIVCNFKTVISQKNFAEEIISSFNDQINDGDFDTSEHWKNNIDRNLKSLVDELVLGNKTAVEEYLNYMFTNAGLRGISMSDEFFTNKNDKFINHTIVHNIVSVSEYCELIPTECLEIGGSFNYDEREIYTLLIKLSDKVGCKLTFPEVFGSFGINFFGGGGNILSHPICSNISMQF